MYEKMLTDSRFGDYHFVWGVRNDHMVPPNKRTVCVNINSLGYYRILAQSGVWIGNTSVERLIHVSGRQHLYLQTWHGIPLKHLGPDEPELNFLTRYWYKHAKFDLLTASGKYDQKIFKHIFPSSRSTQITGLPRNEGLGKDVNSGKLVKLRHSLGLDYGKPTLLLAPTFREYQQDDSTGETKLTLDFSHQQAERLLNKFNVLYRGHYFVGQTQNNPFVDVSKFSNLNQLMEISDLLVTDYSSIMFDFSLLHKPVMLLIEDLDEYSAKRGLYIDPRELGLSFAMSVQELVDLLQNVDLTSESAKVEAFVQRFNPITDLGYASRVIMKKVLNFQ